ncbi:MAG: endolytic transglycosylase MltG [Rickettsiales bacterium]|nr:endolytic transglycosylase MltG [Rickettsiales bacterium]
MRRIFTRFSKFVAISCLFLSVIFGSLFAVELFSVKNDITIFLHEGSSINSMSKVLEEQGAIGSSVVMRSYAKVHNVFDNCGHVFLGEYTFKKGESFSSVLYKVCNGKSADFKITFKEGILIKQVVDIINDNQKASGKSIKYDKEGTILPETYSFKSGISRSKLLSKMRYDFDVFTKKAWEKRDKKLPLQTLEEAIVLASIVEAEAKTDDERPIIASVYLNRLEKGMRLEADPTTIYEITKGQRKLDRQLTLADLRIKGDYNTYQKTGLPIGPICNPGKSSILAVMHPVQTDYLFFVAKSDLSGHVFAKTFEEHGKNVKEQKRIKPKVEKAVQENEEENKTVTVIDKKVSKNKSTKVKKTHIKNKYDTKKVKTKAKTKKKKNKK